MIRLPIRPRAVDANGIAVSGVVFTAHEYDPDAPFFTRNADGSYAVPDPLPASVDLFTEPNGTASVTGVTSGVDGKPSASYYLNPGRYALVGKIGSRAHVQGVEKDTPSIVFKPENAWYYDQQFAAGEPVTVERDGAMYRPATAAEKLAAGGVGAPDYSMHPNAGATLADANTFDWVCYVKNIIFVATNGTEAIKDTLHYITAPDTAEGHTSPVDNGGIVFESRLLNTANILNGETFDVIVRDSVVNNPAFIAGIHEYKNGAGDLVTDSDGANQFASAQRVTYVRGADGIIRQHYTKDGAVGSLNAAQEAQLNAATAGVAANALALTTITDKNTTPLFLDRNAPDDTVIPQEVLDLPVEDSAENDLARAHFNDYVIVYRQDGTDWGLINKTTRHPNEGRGLEFDPQFADIYAQRVADGLPTSVLRDGATYLPATSIEKLAAGGVGAPDYAMYPNAGATLADANTFDWIRVSDYNRSPLIITQSTTLSNTPRHGVSIEYDLSNGPATVTLPENLPDKYELNVDIIRRTDDGSALTVAIGDGTNEPIYGKNGEALAGGVVSESGVTGGFTLRKNKALSRWETVGVYYSQSEAVLPKTYKTEYSYNGSGNTSLKIKTTEAQSYEVTWADGVVDNAANNSNVSHTHPVSDGVVSVLMTEQSFTEATFTGAFDFDTDVIPSHVTVFKLLSNNETFGLISTLSDTLAQYENRGENTSSGDIGFLPESLRFFINQGLNTTFGDIGDLPIELRYFLNAGLNTTHGTFDRLPRSIFYYENHGLNTTTGDLSELPPALQFFISRGLSKAFGDIASLPSTLIFYTNEGNNECQCYSVPVFSTTMRQFFHRGKGLTQPSVDNVLEGLTQVTTWANEKLVDLRGLSAAPSARGLVMVSQIRANGAQVEHN